MHASMSYPRCCQNSGPKPCTHSQPDVMELLTNSTASEPAPVTLLYEKFAWVGHGNLGTSLACRQHPGLKAARNGAKSPAMYSIRRHCSQWVTAAHGAQLQGWRTQWVWMSPDRMMVLSCSRGRNTARSQLSVTLPGHMAGSHGHSRILAAQIGASVCPTLCGLSSRKFIDRAAHDLVLLNVVQDVKAALAVCAVGSINVTLHATSQTASMILELLI